jgi:SAM-dependent methyltransferase
VIQPSDFFLALADAVNRPPPFSVYTTDALWTDPHISRRMLNFHLDAGIDVASRRISFIDESVRWLTRYFGLSARKRVADFGCGPGLYTSRLAQSGAAVTGIDFSPGSIAYAKQQAESSGQAIAYYEADYLAYQLTGQFDLVIMIMCDFCALGPERRSQLLRKFRDVLADGGKVVFDVYSLAAFGHKEESLAFEPNLMSGFWSASPYFGFQASFRYDAERASLDKYTIVEEQQQRQIYNWLQYFSLESLEKELQMNGLEIESAFGDVAGAPWDAGLSEFAVVARRA